jgi:hypothetical protein
MGILSTYLIRSHAPRLPGRRPSSDVYRFGIIICGSPSVAFSLFLFLSFSVSLALSLSLALSRARALSLFLSLALSLCVREKASARESEMVRERSESSLGGAFSDTHTTTTLLPHHARVYLALGWSDSQHDLNRPTINALHCAVEEEEVVVVVQQTDADLGRKRSETHALSRTHARTRTHTHARTHTHTHTHTHIHTHKHHSTHTHTQTHAHTPYHTHTHTHTPCRCLLHHSQRASQIQFSASLQPSLGCSPLPCPV